VKDKQKRHDTIFLNRRMMAMRNANDLLAFAIKYSYRMDLVNLVTALNRTAKICESSMRSKIVQCESLAMLLSQIEESFRKHLAGGTCVPRAVSQTVWALAKLQYPKDDSPLMDVVTQLVLKHSQDFRAAEMMNVVWAYADLASTFSDSKLFLMRACEVSDVVAVTGESYDAMTTQQGVYFTWALARLSDVIGHANKSPGSRGTKTLRSKIETLVASFAGRIVNQLHTLDSKNLAMLAWSLAHTFHRVDRVSSSVAEVLRAIAHEVANRDLNGFLPGELASFVWAIAKVPAVSCTEFLDKFRAHALEKRFEKFSPQDLSNIACGFVKLNAGSDPFYLALADAAMSKYGRFTRLEQTMLSWALTQVPHLRFPRVLLRKETGTDVDELSMLSDFGDKKGFTRKTSFEL